MNITIRDMQPKEAWKVSWLGIKTFHSMEGIFIGKPKLAVVAIDNERIVGAAIIKVIPYQGGKLGYVDYAFVDAKSHGQGIGTKLYKGAVDKLRSLGCNEISALVRGDNPASFSLFEKMGIHRCSLSEVKRILGTSGTIKYLADTPLIWGPASDFYLSSTTQKKNSFLQILWYLGVNSIIFLLWFFLAGTRILPPILAGLTILSVMTLGGSSVLLFRKEKYRFRLSSCGFMISAIITSLGGFFPMDGKWYPEQFNQSKQQKWQLCMGAMIQWGALLLLNILTVYVFTKGEYVKYLNDFSKAMLIYHLLPTYPMNAYESRRIYDSSKVLYAATWVITVAFLCII